MGQDNSEIIEIALKEIALDELIRQTEQNLIEIDFFIEKLKLLFSINKILCIVLIILATINLINLLQH